MNFLNSIIPAALDVTRVLFLEVQLRLQSQHVSILARGADLTLWTHHASGWFTHLRSHGVPFGKGLSWITLNAKVLQIFQNPSQHPQVFDPNPEAAPVQIQVSVPILSSNQEPLGVLHILRNPTQPFEKHELTWLTQQAQIISLQLEAALSQQDVLLDRLTQSPSALLIQDFAMYLGESQPIAQAMAWAALDYKTSPSSLPLETRQALEQQDCRFDGTGKPALQSSNIALSARVLQVILAYLKQLEQGLGSADALAMMRREAGWKLDPLLVHALEQFLR